MRRRRAALAAGVITALTASSVLVTPAAYAEEVSSLTPFDAVDQFIGTEMNDQNTSRGNDHYGNTFPGATLPFGMVQSSPTTFETGNGQQYGGYEYNADQLRGFGMTRLSGTGCRSNFGGFDFPVIPFTGALSDGALPSNPASAIGDYFLDFSHEGEEAEPGYYSVDLESVQAELTSTTRTAVSRYSFDENAESSTLLFEAGGSNNQVHASDIAFDPTTGVLSGSVKANIVCNGGSQYTAYFSATFDQPVESYGVWTPAGVQAGGATASAATKHGAGAYLTFADGADVTAKIGLSYVSVAGARANADAETATLDFDQTRAQARAVWEEALGSIDATGGTDRDRITFYTSLYHSLLHPNTFQDVDGTYTGYDGQLHQVQPGRDFYVNFSGWDTYRGQSQLVALLYPERASDINQSIVDMVTQSGKWTSWPTYNQIQTKMSGDSLQNIVAATDDFGSTDYDRAKALETMLATQTLPMTNTGRSDAVMYGIHGWVDGDKGGAATSRTIEYTTNDFAIAQLAKRLGDDAAYDRFSTRSQNWKNIFNTATGHIDARNRNGFLNTSLTTQGAQFEQSTGYQYGFNVSHNMADLIELRGGKDKATEQLDHILRNLDAGAFSDGAYIANQPSFGLPWVYNWLQAPHKTTETLYRAADQLFTTDPDGLFGNDDLGSFSAWYVWANIGLMPAIWGTADLLVSAPMFEHIEITSIGSERTITIDAPGAGDDRRYTTGLSVNDVPQTASWLPADFARTGGDLDFTMGATAGTWGTGAADVPPSFREGSDNRNSVGITSDGAVNMGGLDAGGIGLSREDLAKAGVTGGAKLPLGDTGIEFTWPDTKAGEVDHWIPNGQVLEFGDVAASGISFLGLATNGPSRGTALVTYTDGSTKTVDVRLTDWTNTGAEPGNIRLVPLTKRNTLNGGSDTAKPNLFATAVVPLDAKKTVRSVTLPNDVSKGIMHVFDVALRPVDTMDPGEPALPTRPQAQEPTAPTTPEPVEIDGTSVLSATTAWRFHDTEADPAAGLPAKTDWTAADYDDSSWKTGTGGFGAKSGAIADLGGGFTPTTLVSQYKADGTTNVETFFFRTTFDLTAEDLAQITQLNGEIAYDDAARVYVNGTKVGGFADERVDAATGNMVYAGGNGTAPLTGNFTVPAPALRAGTNTIAVQVHNTNAGSSDVYMQLTSLTIAAAGAPAAISDVLLHVGSDETKRNLTFYTDREIDAQVQVAPASARTGAEFPVAAAREIDATTAASRDGRFSNQVVIDGLQEETSYLYRVGNDEMGWSRSYELWTGTFDESYSFVYLTDAQIGASGSWQNDRDRWAASLGQIDQFEKDASMIVSGGDQIETHRSEDEYGSLIAPELLKQLPFQATIGNHDNQSDQFNSHFFTPNRSETHGYESTAGRAGGDYWYTYNGVLYLNINTNARSANEEDHAAFLRQVVEEQGAEANWIVVVMHHSLYSAAFHSVEQDVKERRAALAPVFSELGVDLVLAGHDHIYTRSYLMDGTTPVGDLDAQEKSGVTLAAEEGQVLYVTGNSSSGSKFYGLDASSPEAAVKDQSNQPQYTDVDVTPEAITLTTYQTMDRKVIDEVTLTRTADDGKGPEFSGLPAASDAAQGQPFDALAGITATDEVDGDMTSSITVTGTVDVTTPGSYTLTYRVTDLAGNATEFVRTVTVTAVEPTFRGVPPTRTVVEGQEFDERAGITATDANGADITALIRVELVRSTGAARMVGPSAGAYTLVYTVTDAFGTTAVAQSAVTVVPAADPTDPGTGDGSDSGSGTDAGTGSGTDAADDELATTGGEASLLWMLGLLTLLAGAGLVIRRRRAEV
ncbi:GH92 family glycosyl hydrolase [Microbacterium sp. 179-I 3D4 NHS]|uniref:GH92 family glycosyl hydrolase n=1 Tax=Microbacterium sp. 179-I 3D4 NHS TaxID=3142381 RepID=UPI00399EF9FD